MSSPSLFRFCPTAFALPFLTLYALAGEPSESEYRLPESIPPASEILPQAEGHPLAGPLKCAYQTYERLSAEVHDYTCTFVKRERIDGKVKGYRQIETKVRQQRVTDEGLVPFSVYMKYVSPSHVKDREVLFVEGANDGRMLVRQGGHVLPNLVHRLVPDSRFALLESNYMVSEFGMRNMVAGLINVMIQDLEHDECEVVLASGVDVKGNKCTHFRVTHPVERPHFRYHIAEVYLDEQLLVPVYYAAYSWPEHEGGPPQLLEKFAYQNVKLNIGLGDADFDRNNPEYGFGKLSTTLRSAE